MSRKLEIENVLGTVAILSRINFETDRSGAQLQLLTD